MTSTAWTPFCSLTGKSHENLIQCPDCHAQNPRVSSISSSISVRSGPVDLTLDSPPPRTQAAVSVSAAPKFANYNRESGAETLRQAHFSQRGSSVRVPKRQNAVTPNLGSYRAIVTFALLCYELVDGLSQTISYQVLGTYDIRS